ncbi:MAG: (5-formylfuran-3-yl)methyl phosphate synthase [Ignisphaera sp.]
MRKPKLLISVYLPSEVSDTIEGGADIVDIKDPLSGSLGLPRIGVVKEVIRLVNGLRETSVAIGDIRRYAPEIGYVATTIDGLVNYIKVGFAVRNYEEASQIAREVMENSSKSRVIFVGYADYMKWGVIDPLDLIDIATSSKAHGVMIDTLSKNGLSTFDILSKNYLKEFVEKAKKNDLLTAIAGGLKKDHIRDAVLLGFDVIGFRGAVCVGGRGGHVSRNLVYELRRIIDDHFQLLTTIGNLALNSEEGNLSTK